METVNESISKDTDRDENDLQLKLKKLTERVTQHELEKQKMHEEFGLQRAKMKELFLQKEDELKKGSSEKTDLLEEIKRLQSELNDARTQVTVVTLELEGRFEEQKRRLQDEVASLQRLVTETLDESSRNVDEVQRLLSVNERLESEMEELRNSMAHSNVTSSNSVGGGEGPTPLLTAPGAMISTLARKVVSQLGADSSPSLISQTLQSTHSHLSNITGQNVNSEAENLEESMRKAQEDAEVLRSLVIPLEEEIKALKDKLRETDEQLRKYQQNEPYFVGDSHSISNKDVNITSSSNQCVTSTKINDSLIKKSPSTLSLSMASSQVNANSDVNNLSSSCISPFNDVSASNTGIDDVKQQSISVNDECDISSNNKNLVYSNSDNNIRKSMCDMCINYEAQLVSAQDKLKDLEKQVATLERCKEELAKEALSRKDMEQKWNEKKELHKIEVAELKSRAIEAEKVLKEIKETFSSTKSHVLEELKRLSDERKTVQAQLDSLQLENENLVGKRNTSARELQDEVINLPDNVEELQEMLLKCREDLISARVGQEAAEQLVDTLKEEAQLHLYQSQAENQTRQHMKNSLTGEIDQLQVKLKKSDSARHQLQLQAQRAHTEEKGLRLEIEDINMQLISTTNAKKQLEEQVLELKSSLHNSEIVQKDFVRLSQSLQQELERIRSSHTQVRWEHEEDVEQCPGCRSTFSVTRRKQHCKHCGRIFCTSCLTHTVSSGPNQRPSKVCDVCHTLLVQDTAPYFSTEPPHSNN